LHEAGYDFVVATSEFVDAAAPLQNREPLMLAIELASQKARQVHLETLPTSHASHADPAYGTDQTNVAKHTNKDHLLILAADTIAVGDDNLLLGKPESKEEAGEMIRSFINQTHRVVTGVCLWQPGQDQEEVFADVAEVTLGEVTDEQLDAYLATDAWQGKAGGYNLSHVRKLGWPIEVAGDETAVMGLPMQRLVGRLEAWGVWP